jgi:predicted nuclease of predicted toxin-antitoxin system
MRFLVDADLPRPTAPMLRDLGHDAVDVRDIGMGSADDERIAEYAQAQKLCLLSGDFGFADIRLYPPQDYHGIVVLTLPKDAHRDYILHLVERFVSQTEVLNRLPGRLAIVGPDRIRLRPA